MSFKLDLSAHKVTHIRSVLIGFAVLAALFVLSYALFHNPHKNIHAQIFATAEKIRTYYRDRPSYWQLSTATAKKNKLIADELLKYADYDIQIGQGADGTPLLPIDTSFDISLKHLNKSACISLSELPINKSQQLGLLKITIITEQNSVEYGWDEQNPLPIKRYATRNICQATENTIIWTFQ